jgi:predicted RNA-binding protein YlxR (DUF448 family)
MAGKRRKHIPQRTCVACREKFDKRRLTRVVRVPEDGVAIDPTGKQPGRGAYVCDRPECWEKILSSNLLDRALRTKISATAKEALASFQTSNEDDV